MAKPNQAHESTAHSDVLECANEVCVAIETLKTAFPEIFASSYVAKTLLQRKAELRNSLDKAGQP